MIKLDVERAGTGRSGTIAWSGGKLSLEQGDLTEGELGELRAALRGPFDEVVLDDPVAGAEPTQDKGTLVESKGTATADALMFAVHHLPVAGFDPVWSSYENDEPQE